MTDTLIFVDVDGVLNVAVHDRSDAPLLLSDKNLDMAARFSEPKFGAGQAATSAKLTAAAERYGDLACVGVRQTSEVLLERMARLIVAAGERRSVVLSSNWRHPKHAERVEELERELTERLGCSFKFDDRTPLVTERSPGDRLRNIGQHVRRSAVALAKGNRPLRILIVDDFFASAMNGWMCGGVFMRSAQDVKTFVRKCAPSSMDVQVELVHCYEAWRIPSGDGADVEVEVGTGLSEQAVREAEAFFESATAMESPWSRAKTAARRGGKGDVASIACWAGMACLAQLAPLLFH